jgi:ATPase family AAA domain-containing protein 3A/B
VLQAPLGANAVTEIRELFRWARSTPQGMLLFIDEAEAFLGHRSRLTAAAGASENLRNVLSVLLYEAGSQSQHFMLVIATNRPEDVDPAVTDRIDEVLQFRLPDEEVCACLRVCVCVPACVYCVCECVCECVCVCVCVCVCRAS